MKVLERILEKQREQQVQMVKAGTGLLGSMQYLAEFFQLKVL